MTSLTRQELEAAVRYNDNCIDFDSHYRIAPQEVLAILDRAERAERDLSLQQGEHEKRVTEIRTLYTKAEGYQRQVAMLRAFIERRFDLATNPAARDVLTDTGAK